MATAISVPTTTITDEQRRWVVIGICLNKLLCPLLRTVLGKEISNWYNNLCLPPSDINKQTYRKEVKTLPPSKVQLNYGNINNNYNNHKSVYHSYDYNVKDPESLARLFVQPFMAVFTGFDQTMDLSAALTLTCESSPFFTSGAAALARKVRSDVRNEWAHCNFSHWSDVNYLSSIQDIESLVKKLNLSRADEDDFVNKLNNWKDKGVQLCCGQAVDPELLGLVKNEVSELYELYECAKIWREESTKAQLQLMHSLQSVQQYFINEIQTIQQTQAMMARDIEDLKEHVRLKYETTSEQLEVLENKLAKLAIADKDVPYLFLLPDRTEWFSGRECELNLLGSLLQVSQNIDEPKVHIVSVCGLGGNGKTSLVAEYAHRWKDDYSGGVFWFSGEDEATFAKSVDDSAVYFGTLDTSPGRTLVKTLEKISKIQKPWLLVLDDMDECKVCSSIRMLLSGAWKRAVRGSGHILITTRRKPKVMSETIRGFKESQCLQLECFNLEDGKDFVFKRTGVSYNEETSAEASNLVETLGGLPLALEQACAYISHLPCTLPMYLEQYKQYSLELLNERQASSASLYESPQRLAVRTTWLLNINYIKQSTHGDTVVRFLKACAFFNFSEIQKELINPGKPLIADEAYREYVNTPLGPTTILKLLTDFSLFKENKVSSLTVHRLVQEVIRGSFHSEEYVSSFVDAVRFLCCAFSFSRSPDDLLTSMVIKKPERASLQATDPSLFHKWNNMCLHAQEVRKHLLDFLKSSKVRDQRILLPETARLVYECALYFNVNSKQAEAKKAVDFAHEIIRLGDTTLSKDDLATLFPHEIPLPEIVRKVIFYSCIAPCNTKGLSSVVDNKDVISNSDLEKMRIEGNSCYKQGDYRKAAEIYTCAVNKSKGTISFDATLLSNRASAYIKLQKYEDALVDAESYTSYHPECWKGFARKAQALSCLKKIWEAICAAALAFYCERSIFDKYEPFKDLFSSVKDRISICNNSSPADFLALFRSSFSRNESGIPSKIVILEPGDYILRTELFLDDCILIGVEDRVAKGRPLLTFEKNFGIASSKQILVENISFAFDSGIWVANTDTSATMLKCSFTSNVQNHPRQCAFLSSGTATFANCHFQNCKENALGVIGKAVVEKCVFSANGSCGVRVFFAGELKIKDSKLHGNKLGIHIAQDAGRCRIMGCEIYDNHYQGIGVFRSGQVDVEGNRIYQNDRHGVFIEGKSFARIQKNEIFENGWNGIATMDNARCNVLNNKVYRNKRAGVQVVPVGPGPAECHSVVKNNEIYDNNGPGIYDEMIFQDHPSIPKQQTLNEHILYYKNREQMRKAKLIRNKLKNNEKTDPEVFKKEQEPLDFCSFCGERKPLRKCKGCFGVGYCSKECQKNDWRKKHKSQCATYLDESSIIVNVLPKQGFSKPSKGYRTVIFNQQAPGLDPKGPDYANPPKPGERFMVKVQACDGVRQSNLGGALLTLYDRSMTIHGDLDYERCPLYHTVRQCGENAQGLGWRKMFFWALLCDSDSQLRIFTKKLPYQSW